MKLFLFIYIVLFLQSGFANGSTITLDSVTPSIVLDGDEYFTDVHYDRIDFDKRRDFLWEGFYDETSITVVDHVWSGTYSPQTSVWPLYQGAPSALPIGKIGKNYPLDTSKYTYISTQYKLIQRFFPGNILTDQTTHRIMWPDGAGGYHNFLGLDAHRTTNSTNFNDDGAFITYLHDLSGNTDWTSSPIEELRHVPRMKNMPTSVSYRWFRIIDPTTSPTITVNWSATISPEDMPPSGTPQVEVYFDTDNQDYDGVQLFYSSGGTSSRNVNYTDGNYSFLSAVLEPGTYYFCVKLYDNYDDNSSDLDYTNDTLLATSHYSDPVSINGKSSISFEHPSRTSGADYATEVLKDPWDMDDNASDLIYTAGVTAEFYNSGIYTATTATSDSRLFLNVDTQNPIDTSRYHYLTYTMEVNESGWETSNISNRLGSGWITRLFWGHTASPQYYLNSQTDDIIDYEGINVMTLDLRTDCLDPDAITLPQQAWESNASVYYFRLDPLETSQSTTFHLHDVKLTADPEPEADGNFTVRFVLDDPEGDNATVDFYIDTDQSGYDGDLIGSDTFNTGMNFKTFNTLRWKRGLNYLYVVITDSMDNVSQRYADAPIVVTNVRTAISPALLYYLLN